MVHFPAPQPCLMTPTPVLSAWPPLTSWEVAAAAWRTAAYPQKDQVTREVQGGQVRIREIPLSFSKSLIFSNILKYSLIFSNIL